MNALSLCSGAGRSAPPSSWRTQLMWTKHRANAYGLLLNVWSINNTNRASDNAKNVRECSSKRCGTVHGAMMRFPSRFWMFKKAISTVLPAALGCASEKEAAICLLAAQKGMAVFSFFYFCYHCCAECPGGMLCSKFPSRNDRMARSIAQQVHNEHNRLSPIVVVGDEYGEPAGNTSAFEAVVNDAAALW